MGALAQLVEQPRVLDCDDRLIGESLDERDLLVAEYFRLKVRDTDRPMTLLSRMIGAKMAERKPNSRANCWVFKGTAELFSISENWRNCLLCIPTAHSIFMERTAGNGRSTSTSGLAVNRGHVNYPVVKTCAHPRLDPNSRRRFRTIASNTAWCR